MRTAATGFVLVTAAIALIGPEGEALTTPPLTDYQEIIATQYSYTTVPPWLGLMAFDANALMITLANRVNHATASLEPEAGRLASRVGIEPHSYPGNVTSGTTHPTLTGLNKRTVF